VRGPKNNLVAFAAAVVLACATLQAGLSAAEEVNPAAIPWEHIEAYASGKIDQNPFVPGAKIQLPQPQPEKPKVEQPKAESKPGVKQKDPEQIAVLKRLVQKQYDEELKAAARLGLKQQFEMYLRFDKYDEAFKCLGAIQIDPKKYASEHRGDWLNYNIWTVGLMLNQRLPKGALDKFYQTWDQELDKPPAENGGWHHWYKQRKEYWASGDKIKDQLQELERQGETDGEALWTLVNLYNQQRPPSNVQFAVVLYRLREWFPEYQHIKSGDAQWLLIMRLWQLHLWEQAEAEINLQLERWPNQASSKDGEAAWHLAHAFKQQAYEIGKNNAGYEKAKEALQLFQNFQRKYPKSPHNQQQQHNRPGSNNCSDQIGEINN